MDYRGILEISFLRQPFPPGQVIMNLSCSNPSYEPLSWAVLAKPAQQLRGGWGRAPLLLPSSQLLRVRRHAALGQRW